MPERVTACPTAHEQLLYFTSSSLWADDSHLVFISDRTGHPNLFRRDLSSGDEQQLTHNQDGVLKSYVYFGGTPYRGFGKASVALHAASGTVYYLQGREIRRVDADGVETTLAEYPAGQMTAFCHVSSDGRRLCVPTTDARALDDETRFEGKPPYNIDARVREEGLSSYLRIYDTASGEELIRESVPRCWITHVQFSPTDPERIVYNHEWPSDCGSRRVWLFDGTAHHRLREAGAGRAVDDWVCHEMWERDGSGIVYHGKFANGRPFVGRVTPDGRERSELALPTGCDRYGHFTSGAPGVLVTDGYYEQPNDAATRGGDWISRLEVDWTAGEIDWTPLCRSASSWDSQDAHPHPIIDHGGRFVYFTSDRDGKRAVYRVPLR